jgi:glycosyltransferase involved in cell wall biosynthesis
MEDNEEQLMGDTLRWRGVVDPDALDDDALEGHLTVRRSHPRRFRGFIAGAAGYSCLIDPLLEFAPPDAPQAVFWPGYDFEPGPDTDPRTERDGLGIAADELIVFYPGNTHRSNVGDVVDLYTACILARRQGARIRLVRTGVSHAPIRLDPDLDPAGVVVELGFVDRARLAPLMSAADILVQPGRPGPFNDYRFPSKLPEFLAAGRPVVLPATNLGRHLQNGVEALVLDTGSVEEMVEAIMRLAGDADLRRRLGGAGRRFAQARLSWANAGGMLNELYRTVLATSATPSG